MCRVPTKTSYLLMENNIWVIIFSSNQTNYIKSEVLITLDVLCTVPDVINIRYAKHDCICFAHNSIRFTFSENNSALVVTHFHTKGFHSNCFSFSSFQWKVISTKEHQKKVFNFCKHFVFNGINKVIQWSDSCFSH